MSVTCSTNGWPGTGKRPHCRGRARLEPRVQPGPHLSRLGSSEQGVWGLGPQGSGPTCHPSLCSRLWLSWPEAGSLPVLLGLRLWWEEPAHPLRSGCRPRVPTQGSEPFSRLRTTQAAPEKQCQMPDRLQVLPALLEDRASSSLWQGRVPLRNGRRSIFLTCDLPAYLPGGCSGSECPWPRALGLAGGQT